MKMRWAFLPVLMTIASYMGISSAHGQGYAPANMPSGSPPMYMPAGYSPNAMPGGPQGMAMGPGMMQPGMMGPASPVGYAQTGGLEAPGGSLPPEAYSGPMENGVPMMGGDGYGMPCEDCGPRGRFGGGGGLLGDLIGLVGPEGAGGCAAPRWFDVNVDFMLLKRDRVSRLAQFSSNGIAGPIVLDSTDLRFYEAPGFRFQSMLQMGAGSDIEFTYFGTFSWNAHAEARGNATLFSALSQYGTLPFNGFQETDNGDYHAINYKSTFDNFEVNYRNRWLAPNSRYQGSWLVGVRYFSLNEKFNYDTISVLNNGQMNYNDHVLNNLTGAQIGGDLWICLLPGLRIGGEAKVGVYGNHAISNTTISATSLATAYEERVKNNDVAFVGDAQLLATYRVNQQWTLKLGYQCLVVDGVALAIENFNPTPPLVFFPPPGVNRTPTINDNGSMFYHGLVAGAEFLW